ncbi:MAG TPA: hypothetical protein VF595_05050 [Tepidisphaeraceae bacterium]|jgi:Ca2+-binding RTX toxin-like protein
MLFDTLEMLESRRLLAATLTSATLNNDGVVVLTGSAQGDEVQVALFSRRRAQIIDGGEVVLTFRLAAAKSLSFTGGAGSDTLSMGRVPLPLNADGGDGADSFSASRGGAFDDSLLGGSANDYLFGGPGNDRIEGGGGDDQLHGDEGNDYLIALSDSSGDDTILGGPGEDTVDFSNYNRGVTLSIGARSPGVLQIDDRVSGQVEIIRATGYSDRINNISGDALTVYLGRGFDRYTGGRAAETVYGGRGDDTIATAGAEDTIFDTEGTNTLSGGRDRDTAFVRGNADGIEAIEIVRDVDEDENFSPNA